MGILDAFGKGKVTKQETNSVEKVINSTDDKINNVSASNLPENKPSEEQPSNPTELVTSEELEEIEIDDEVLPDVPVILTGVTLLTEKSAIAEATEELSRKPVDQKKAELEFYKFYAREADSLVNNIILKHGPDTESILNEIEVYILQLQKNQQVCRILEQHTRLKRSLTIQERSAKDLEKRRKRDLNYVPMLADGETKAKARKVSKKVSKAGKSQKDRMVDDLVSRGLTREQAEKLVS